MAKSKKEVVVKAKYELTTQIIAQAEGTPTDQVDEFLTIVAEKYDENIKKRTHNLSVAKLEYEQGLSKKERELKSLTKKAAAAYLAVDLENLSDVDMEDQAVEDYMDRVYHAEYKLEAKTKEIAEFKEAYKALKDLENKLIAADKVRIGKIK